MAYIMKVPAKAALFTKCPVPYTEMATKKTHNVFPVRCADLTSSRMMDTVRAWADGTEYLHPNQVWHDIARGVVTPRELFTELIVDNYPISNIRAIGEADKRTIKGITMEKWLVEIDQDDFMYEAFTGTLQYGVLTRPYVWSRMGSRMLLKLA